ncbi:MAG: hypothetical protein LBB38_02555 [Puniceicoccales bacterium]|jgi:hypothetical protein|nr:hypothetical protein [Puniceicoccales bacterium]
MNSPANVLFAAAVTLVLGPVFVLGCRRCDMRRALSIFATPLTAVLLLLLSVRIYPFRAPLRSIMVFFALLNLYAVAPFDRWVRWELQLNCLSWSAFRIICVGPLPFMLRNQMQSSLMWALILAIGLGQCILNAIAAIGSSRWKCHIFLCCCGVYPVALFLRNTTFFSCLTILQLSILTFSAGEEFAE